MDFSSIIDDIREWEGQESLPEYDQEKRFSPGSRGALLTRLWIDLAHAAVPISVMSSIANHIGCNPSPRLSPQDLLDFCYINSGTFSDPVSVLIGYAPTTSVAVGLMNCNSRLALAKILTQRLKYEVGVDRDESRNVALEVHSDAWRRICEAILSTMDDIERYLKQSNEPVEAAALDCCKWASALLRRAAEGRSPCVNEQGLIEVPTWAERRIDKREVINVPARIHVGDKHEDVSVIDISKNGIGLSGDVRLGDNVTVELAGGLKCSGVVKWRKDGRFGLQLAQPMDVCDSDREALRTGKP
jgi:hypothetical protein